MSGTVIWFFGRGLSIGCGLTWDLPTDRGRLTRAEKIDDIQTSLAREMLCATTDSIRDFLTHLATNAKSGQRHLFVTTNWDYLLQKEILKLGLTELPAWLSSSHVHHINGSIEQLPDNHARSAFVLVEDVAAQRERSHEAESVFGKMVWERRFVVVGMSFECESDKFLLRALGRVQDDLPISESHWTLVNPDPQILDRTQSLIRENLPNAKIDCFRCTLEQWRLGGMPSLY